MEPNPTPFTPQEPSNQPRPPAPANPPRPVSPGTVAPQTMPGNGIPPVNPGMPAGQPSPNVMVGDGGMDLPTVPTAGNPVVPVAPETPAPASGGGRRITKRVWAAIIVLVLLIAAAAWYFGYYMNPGVIYKQSLKNTGKGYDKLVTYVDKQDQLPQKGYTGTGKYKIKLGDLSTDGKIGFKGDSENAELTFDVGLAATRVNADIRTIKSDGGTPDVYVKAKDIKGLGTVIGVPELDPSLAKLDDSWIVIDHTLIDNISGAATSQANASSLEAPTREQVLDEARAFGQVNQEYLFSTNKNKAVTKVVKNYGKETVDGRKTYHYKVVLQKDNVKKYIYAQRDALKAGKLNDWLKKNKYDKDVYASFDEAAKSAEDIKSTDTYDVWMDTGKRIVYKVRFSEKKNPAANYVDVGLDYQGGDTFPFFIAGSFKDQDATTFKFAATLDTKSGATQFDLDVKNDSKTNGGTVAATLNFKPADETVEIVKPSSAKPLSQALGDLGLGNILGQYTPAQAPAGDDPGAIDDATLNLN